MQSTSPIATTEYSYSKAGDLWPAVALFSLSFGISSVYGFQYVIARQNLVWYFASASLPFAAILAALTWHGVRRWNIDTPRLRWQSTLGFLLMSVSFVSTLYFWSAVLRPAPWSLIALGVLGIAWICHRKWGARGSTLAFVCCAFVFYILAVLRIPQDDGANMLRIIEAASRELLVGKNPHHAFPAIAGDAAFGYLPMLWIPYAVLVWLGLDLRIFNLVALMLLVLLFERGFPRRLRPEILSLTIYPILLSSTVAVMVVHGHVWSYWLLICAAALLLIRKWFFAASLFFGLALAARQPALFLVGPLAAYAFRAIGVKDAIKCATIVAAVFLCVVLPFAVWTGPTYWQNAFLKLSDIITLGNQDPFIGAQSLLDVVGLQGRLLYLQVTLIIAAIAIILLRPRVDAAWFVFLAGTTYVWLVFTAFYSIRYEYLPGLFLMSIGLSGALAGQEGENQQRATHISRPLSRTA